MPYLRPKNIQNPTFNPEFTGFSVKNLALQPWRLTDSKVAGFFLTAGLVLISCGLWLIPIAIGLFNRVKANSKESEFERILENIPPFSSYQVSDQKAPLPLNAEGFWDFDSQLKTQKLGVILNIGNLGILHIWKQKPNNTDVEHSQKLILPHGMGIDEYTQLRQEVQGAVLTKHGLEISRANEIAYSLGGMSFTGIYPFQIDNLLKGISCLQPPKKGEAVDIHYIFQSGLNFMGVKGGGIGCSKELTDEQISQYYQANATAAVCAAVENGSDILVYNPFIGSGFFCSENEKSIVIKANQIAILNAVNEYKKSHPNCALKVMLPIDRDPRFSEDNFICKRCDKDRAAAVLVKNGYKVSLHIAGDPMVMCGLHGPGLWWETCGMASDEERQAFLSLCYKGGYTPVLIKSSDNKQKIAILSEFLVKPA